MSKKETSKKNKLESNNLEENMLNVNLPKWDDMPDISLYMDQVLLLMDKYIGTLLGVQDKNSILTPSMINNYVKLGVMPAPENKRYSREHLAYLIIICLMKQTLSMASIITIIKSELQIMSITELFTKFSLYYNEYIDSVLKHNTISLVSTNNTDKILKLGIISNITRLTTENMLNAIIKPDILTLSSKSNKNEKQAKNKEKTNTSKKDTK